MLQFDQVNPEHCIHCHSTLVDCTASRETYWEPDHGDCVEPAQFRCMDCGESFDELDWEDRDDPDCPHCCASGPDRIKSGWYCYHCDRQFNLDDLDRSGEPAEADHPRPHGWHRGGQWAASVSSNRGDKS